jgi:tetratricopeptide (TPR) repeat protein
MVAKSTAKTGIILWGTLSEGIPKEYQTRNTPDCKDGQGFVKTRFLVYLISIIPLAGTLVRFVPPPRTPPLETAGRQTLRKDLLARLEQSRNVSRQGDFRDGATLAQGGYRDSRSAGETQIAAQFLNVLGGCRFAVHQYRDALQTYLEARKLAEASHDNATAAKLDLNISSLYAHLGQIDAATEAIARATAQLSAPERRAQLPQLLTHLAALQADQGRMPRALDLYR